MEDATRLGYKQTSPLTASALSSNFTLHTGISFPRCHGIVSTGGPASRTCTKYRITYYCIYITHIHKSPSAFFPLSVLAYHSKGPSTLCLHHAFRPIDALAFHIPRAPRIFSPNTRSVLSMLLLTIFHGSLEYFPSTRVPYYRCSCLPFQGPIESLPSARSHRRYPSFFLAQPPWIEAPPRTSRAGRKRTTGRTRFEAKGTTLSNLLRDRPQEVDGFVMTMRGRV